MKMRRWEKLLVNGSGHSHRVAEQAEKRLRTLDPQPGQRLLDVGCGNGAATIHLARAFDLAVTGLDVDPEQIDAATIAAGAPPAARFVVGNATELPFGENAYDLVYSNKTTHHVSDWPRALDEMARVLAPGGCLVYSDFVAPFGCRLPTRKGLDAVLATNGLERVRHSGSPFHYTVTSRRVTH